MERKTFSLYEKKTGKYTGEKEESWPAQEYLIGSFIKESFIKYPVIHQKRISWISTISPDFMMLEQDCTNKTSIVPSCRYISFDFLCLKVLQ